MCTRSNRITEAVLTSIHDLCFGAKIRKKYPCKPQFYYIKVGCNGVFVTRTCFRDVNVAYLCTLFRSSSDNIAADLDSLLGDIVRILYIGHQQAGSVLDIVDELSVLPVLYFK